MVRIGNIHLTDFNFFSTCIINTISHLIKALMQNQNLKVTQTFWILVTV